MKIFQKQQTSVLFLRFVFDDKIVRGEGVKLRPNHTAELPITAFPLVVAGLLKVSPAVLAPSERGEGVLASCWVLVHQVGLDMRVLGPGLVWGGRAAAFRTCAGLRKHQVQEAATRRKSEVPTRLASSSSSGLVGKRWTGARSAASAARLPAHNPFFLQSTILCSAEI